MYTKEKISGTYEKHALLLTVYGVLSWRLKLRIECEGFTVDEFLHLIFRQSMLLEVKAKRSHAYWFITHVMQRIQVRVCKGTFDWKQLQVECHGY